MSQIVVFLRVILILSGLFLGSPELLHGQELPVLKRQLRDAQSDSARTLVFIELGRNFIQINLDSSWYYLNKAIKLGQKLSDKRPLIKAYNVLATTYVVTGEHTKGLAILRQAEQFSRAYPFDTLQLELQARLTQTYRVQGNYKLALQTGLSLERRLDNHPDLQTSSLITLYNELAIIHEHQHNDSLVLPYYLKANELALRLRRPKVQIGTLGNLGEYYLKHKEFAKAEDFMKKSLAISRKLNYNHSTAESLRNLGEISREQHQYKSAITYYKQALVMQQQIGAKEFIGYIYVQLAQSYASLNELHTALDYTDKSIQLFRSIQSPHYLYKALTVKASFQEKRGNLNDALRLFRQAQTLQDSLTGLEKQKAIAEIQAGFDLERNQNQIANLKRDLSLQKNAKHTIQLQLTLAQHQRTFYFVVSLLLLLIAIIISINFNRQKQAKQLLSQQQKAILEQTDQLIELNKAKDQLFSIISHDVRSPLVHLKQDIRQMQLAGQSGNRPSVVSLIQLEQKTDTILSLLMTLLDWAYVQFKGFKVNLQIIDLTEQVAQTVSYFSDRLQQKQISLINQVNARTLVLADSQLLAIIIRNLVDNAVKFTPESGYIRLLTIEHTDTIELQIRDTGIGMTTAMLNQLFVQPEVRKGTQDEPGTGLGMQICQELLLKQQGQLLVKSQPNKGTTVKVILTKPLKSVNSGNTDFI